MDDGKRERTCADEQWTKPKLLTYPRKSYARRFTEDSSSKGEWDADKCDVSIIKMEIGEGDRIWREGGGGRDDAKRDGVETTAPD